MSWSSRRPTARASRCTSPEPATSSIRALIEALPDSFFAVRYLGARFPGSADVAARPGIALGANCQLFAYAVLRHFGLHPPALRSSELWADTDTTIAVSAARPLDLVLLNSTAESWGAHLAVCVAADQLLHLCAEVGHPVVWNTADFAAHKRYNVLVGIKRVLR